MMPRIIFSLFFTTVILSCLAQNTTNHANDERCIMEGIFAYEDCEVRGFSFCSDGAGQSYQFYPFLVQLNKENFLKSYDSLIFAIYDNNNIEMMDDYMYRYTIDSLLNSLSSNYNLISIYCPWLEISVNDGYKTIARSKAVFSGFMKYHLFKIKFEYIDYGDSVALINHLLFGKREQPTCESYAAICVRYACIKKIISVEPMKGYTTTLPYNYKQKD